MDKKYLYAILMSKDVVKMIKNHKYKLLKIIPEIEPMIGFEHKHPHHHLDVWEHTLLALSNAPLDFTVRLVLLLHDIGKPHCFQEEGEIRHFKGHPEISKDIAKKVLERLEFDKEEIDEMCYLIEKHDFLLAYNQIRNNTYLSKKIFQIQYCDALAHHPEKLEKRINYLLKINEMINAGESKARYNAILNKMLKEKR